MGEIKVYFRGDSEIENPVDIDNNLIYEGDILTRDYGDYEKYNIIVRDYYPIEPFYLVKINKNGYFYAESVNIIDDSIGNDKRFYLHDFRFKYCKKINK